MTDWLWLSPDVKGLLSSRLCCSGGYGGFYCWFGLTLIRDRFRTIAINVQIPEGMDSRSVAVVLCNG